MEERRPLRRQPDDHNFGPLLMLAVTAGAFLLITWILDRHQRAFLLPSGVSNSLKANWQKLLASQGYFELGMFDDAANALEEIEPEDKIRKEVLGARVDLYMAAKKWDMAAAVATHLVKVEPEKCQTVKILTCDRLPSSPSALRALCASALPPVSHFATLLADLTKECPSD